MAKQIRPLIGLTEVQAQANANYRDKVYRTYIGNGAMSTVAAAQADKAALRYAGKQHRERAETIVHTELAFAYNRGAHMGVSRAISGGLMGRCEMVWTTAGTNRVCGRCLALKDTVVGYTDESGVTLPPLHPRCRCAIMYNEVGAPKIPIPQIKIIDYEDATKVRTVTEFTAIANDIKSLVEQHAGRLSKWSGEIILADEGEKAGGKLWNCSIRINPDAPEHVLIHEMVHSCSISYYEPLYFADNRAAEELAIHYLSQELASLKKYKIVDSGYDEGVKLLRELKAQLKLEQSDLEFASAIVREAPGKRWDWLAEQIEKSNLSTVEEYMKVNDLMEALQKWDEKLQTLAGGK